MSGRSNYDKIKPLEELGAVAADLRRQGKSVVLCHGVFDLLHLGHVRHLRQGREFGDVLIVTITGDAYVNKGPGRPVFAQAMRAEMLAALEFVDYVGINEATSAETVLHAVKPSIYVKGSEYARPEDDVTGKIVAERDAVELYGGRLEFTDDIVFSSSELINRHLNVYEPKVRTYLDELRSHGGAPAILDWLERIKDFRVLVVGDVIVDEYQYVSPLGKSAKENMIATLFQDRELFAGGVIAAANHVAGVCAEVEVLTCLGGQDSHEELVRQSLKPNVKLSSITRDDGPTTRKCRFIEQGYLRKLFEVYFMNDEPLPGTLQDQFDAMLAERARRYDLVIVTDFGHGLIAPSTIEALIANSKFLAVNAQSNSANMGYNLITRYGHADYICIDAPEARLASGEKFADLATIASERLGKRMRCENIILTQGRNGCVTFQKGGPVHSIPALTQTVVDTVGAGDAFFVVTAPLVAAGMPLEQAGFVGNVAGALKVGIVGHRTSIDKAGMVKSITALLK